MYAVNELTSLLSESISNEIDKQITNNLSSFYNKKNVRKRKISELYSNPCNNITQP